MMALWDGKPHFGRVEAVHGREETVDVIWEDRTWNTVPMCEVEPFSLALSCSHGARSCADDVKFRTVLTDPNDSVGCDFCGALGCACDRWFSEEDFVKHTRTCRALRNVLQSFAARVEARPLGATASWVAAQDGWRYQRGQH